jgi:flavin reductase (DIM6/NTAB) family NADH-FMN oxidoreductase RutF
MVLRCSGFAGRVWSPWDEVAVTRDGVWSAGEGPSACGLTVASVIVTEGEPPHVLGTIGDLTDLLEVIRAAGRFVVHVHAEAYRGLAERFADPPRSWAPTAPDSALPPT